MSSYYLALLTFPSNEPPVDGVCEADWCYHKDKYKDYSLNKISCHACHRETITRSTLVDTELTQTSP